MPLNASSNKFKTERYDLITEAIPNPGVGNMGSWTCPTNRVVEIISVFSILHTSVVVANRRLYLCLDSGGVTTHFTLSFFNLTAGLAIAFIFSLDIDRQNRAANGLNLDPLAAAFELKGGEHLLIGAYNWDVADWFTGLAIRYREWRED